MFETGTGVERNDRMAVWWFQQAAEQEHTEAQARLGIMLAAMAVERVDYLLAVAWL